MLSAYLGGSTVNIVTADYRHGFRSVLREGLLLEAHSKVLGAELQLAQISYEAQYAPLLPPQKAVEILRKRVARLGWLNRLKSMELFAREPSLMGATNLLSLYNALTKANIIRDLEEDETDNEPPTE